MPLVKPVRIAGSAGLFAATDEEAVRRLPLVVAFLSQLRWEDGTERRPGSILVCAEEGKWKAWLNDRDALRSAWLSADTLSDLVTGCERGLAADSLGWRGDRSRKGGKSG